MLNSLIWSLIVTIGIVSIFIVTLLRPNRIAIYSISIAVVISFFGLILGSISINVLDKGLKESIPILLLIISLDIFSIALSKVRFPDRILQFIISKSPSIQTLENFILSSVFFLSIFVNNLAAVLVTLPIIIKITQSLKLDAKRIIPLIIISSNLGGAATMLGDFPNIAIAQYANVNYFDFLMNLGILMTFLFIFLLLINYIFNKYKKDKSKIQITQEKLSMYNARSYYNLLNPIFERFTKIQIFSIIIFILMIICFIYLPISPPLIAFGGAVILMIVLKMEDTTLQEIRVDTLAFFGSLFILGATFESTSLFDHILLSIENYFGASPISVALAIVFISIIITAFFSAGPSTVLLIPLILKIQHLIPGNLEWWLLSIGVFIGSSSTHVGATAGPVALSIYKRETKETFSSITYLKYSLPISFLMLILSLIYILIFFNL